MDGRREPRFEIYAPAKLTLLDSPEREMECILLDISATGLKFVVDEILPMDELVALEAEDHLVLADVRYSQPRGEKFAIGAERIHAVDKSALPQDKSKAEQIRFVVDDYRSRIRLAIAGEKAPVRKTEPELPVQHRDQLAEAAVQQLIEQWAKETDSSASDGALRAAIVERAAERVAERTPVAQPVTGKKARSAWRLPFVTASAIAMMAFTGSLFWSYRHSAAASVSPAAVAPPRPVAQSDPSIPVTVSTTRHAEIRVTEPVWVVAVSDGKEVFRKLLAKDETRKIDFADTALVRVGNAGGVEISVDGKSLGPLGQRGQIKALEITADCHRFVPLTSLDPSHN